jgi:hypothetical protein
MSEEVGLIVSFDANGIFLKTYRILAQISPENIESFMVLKDAAASIYGADWCKWCHSYHNQKRKKGKQNSDF